MLLSTKNLRQRRPSKKLSNKFEGPLRVLEPVGKQAYRLQLPNYYSRLHNMFYMLYLEPYNRREGNKDPDYMPMPELLDDGEDYEVEEVLDRRRRKGELQYLVKWRGWSTDYNQWVAEADMAGAEELREAFDSRPKARKRRRGAG